MHHQGQGSSELVFKDDQDFRYLNPAKRDRLNKTHFQGALVRSGASVLIWFLTLAAYEAGVISKVSFEGASVFNAYIILMNIPMLALMKRVRGKLVYEFCSYLINILEIFGYTGFIYFVGGFRSTYLTPIYAAMIFYVGVQAPMRYPLIITFFCSMSFSTMVTLEHFGYIPHQNMMFEYNYQWNMVLFILGVFTTVLFVVAFMSSYTAKVLRTAKIKLKEKNLVLEMTNKTLQQEIDERKKIETALRESEEKLHDIFENVTDALFSHDLDGTFIEVNGGFKRSLGISESDPLPVGLNIKELIPEKYKALADKYTAEINRYGRSEGFIRIVTRLGKERIFEYRNSLIRDEMGIPTGVRGSARDITERLIAERERMKLQDQLQRAQKMEAIGHLAGGVAHDLNNILSGLMSYPELLLMETPEDSPLRKPLITIQKSGEKAASIVQDLLTLARRGVSVSEVVNLNQIIIEYLNSLEHERIMTTNPCVDVETSLEADLMNIVGSPVHLFKSIMNLVANAVESMSREGKITITTSSRYIDKPLQGYDAIEKGDYVTLAISDTGTGMTEKDRQRIFEPFYTKKAMCRSGTGLAMAVVWGAVKDHHGYLEVQSEPGMGSTFTLYFPSTPEQIHRNDVPFSIDEYRGNGEKILVVDDVKEQREIAGKILERLGYHVETVSSGEEALERIKYKGFDLLVLDMIMNPGIDGLETYKRVLEINPTQKAVIASGYSETDRVKEALKIGAISYIKKPYLLQKIGIAIKEALARKAA
ncbi:MAG TPA: response regulator [Desulfomonilia bacterium]|nr:response regulator [Desulfomonilia bacterium]